MKKVSVATSGLTIAGALMIAIAAPLPAHAGLFSASEVKRWDVCDWERIPDNVMERITNRNDFDDILRRMFDACPDSALALTDRPTASVSVEDSGDRSGTPDSGVSGPSGDDDDDDDDDETDDTDEEPDYGLPG